MSTRRPISIVAVTCTAVTLLWFAPPGHAQAPRFQSGIDMVVVDVNVIGSDGAPLATLTKPDFVLTVDGTPREIGSVTMRDYRVGGADTDGGGAVPVPAPRAGAGPARSPERRFLLLVDRETLNHGDWRKAVKGARSFVDSLPSGDGVGVAILPASNLALRFDLSREAVKKELEKPLQSSFGWDGEAQPTLLAQRSVDDMLHNIEAVVRGLSRLEGAKHLVLVGAPLLECETRVPRSRPSAAAGDQAGQSSPAAQAQAQQAAEQATAAARQARQTERASLMLARTRAIADAAGLGRVRIHTLTLGDSTGWSSPSAQLSNNAEEIGATARRTVGLGTNNLASATGGLALFPVTADTFFNRLSRELSVSYELTFAPQPGDDDGKAHRIEVEVRSAGRVTVRARDEFVIPTGALKTTR
jgi:VWFA-related protein